MNFLQGLEATYGNQINDGLIIQTSLKGKTLDKAKTLVLASSLAGLIRKVSTDRGTDYLFKLLEDYDDTIVENFGNASDANYEKWQTDGEQIMPVLLISSIVKENIINQISRLIKENYQTTKKIFALLIPVLLSYVSKQFKEKNYTKKELVKTLRAQKYNVRMQVDDDITRELGMGTWHLNKTFEDEIEEPMLEAIEIEEEEIIVKQPPAVKSKAKSGMPVWLWPLMLLGVLAMLIVGLQLGLNNEITATKITKTQPANETLADNIVEEKKVEPEVENDGKEYTKDYFNKDYFAESQKNDPNGKDNKVAAKAEIKKEKPSVKMQDTVAEKIEKKKIEAKPIELKENLAKPILPKDKPKEEDKKQPEAEKKEEKPAEEEPVVEEKQPEKPKKKNYKGPLALLDMVANRTTASVLDFGNITDSSSQLTTKGKDMFNDVAEIMTANPNLKITIRGHNKKHTDDNNNYTASIDSEAKANAALSYLLSKGIDAGRLKAVSVGYNEPVNARDPGNDKNNRISIKTK